MNSPASPPFQMIGSGFCGTVWAPASEENSYALKREDGGPGRSLANDHDMHKRTLICLDQLDCKRKISPFPRIQVSRCIQVIDAADSAWWSENLARFPPGHSACNVLQSERIPPLPQPIRERLIVKYCPTALMDEIKASKSNQSCLVRPYLGRRRHGAGRPKRFEAFSLKNFPLHLDQMEHLDLDIASYAEIMAEALAMMHWHGKIDANDVEFVLAPPRNLAHPQSLNGSESSFLGEHTMWMLDFDCCRSMSMDDRGVTQAATAFFRNDPFYPRPSADGSRDRTLWEVFRRRYLQTSFDILVDDPQRLSLPEAFIEKIERG